ncbi:lysophospholipase [Caenimonas koreensis]|uniref:alpha/beta hydrolase n=1 Tax=Caenimonas koreensis TaxID=367474 RepID=UPI0037833B15
MSNAEPSDSTLSTFTASDGDNLAMQDWPLPEGVKMRGVIVLVHGLGEHAGRYDHVARRLNNWGFAVRGYDHYGHGESGGVRGAISTDTRLVDDLADVIDSTRLRMEDGTPIIVLGHSMGGLVAACFAASPQARINALVLSSPVFDAGLSRFQKFLVSVLPRIAPNLTVGNGLDANYISHDRSVVEAYKADPRVHARISARLAEFIATGGPKVIARAGEWKVPTLLMYAGQDKLVNPAGSRAFVEHAPPGVVTTRCFDQLFHEIFNEPDNEQVFATLKHWLDERF